MKRLKSKLILAMALPFLTACPLPDQNYSEIDFTLFNATDKTVKVLGFDRDFDNPENSVKANPIIINPHSKFKVTRVTGLDDNTRMAFYSLYNGVDSVRVIFNNEKVKIYGGRFGDPCHICIGDENEQHFITEEDYESAIACNEDCE